jgi:HEPN domain-containing protein
MDNIKTREVHSWLKKALQDLRSAEWLIESPDGLYDAVGFHCQQSSEKVLKAYLTWYDQSFGKTHSLVALIGICLDIDKSFEDLRKAATTLTPYAVTTRYPGDLPEIPKSEAEEAIRLAHFVWDFVTNMLPSDTHPIP